MNIFNTLINKSIIWRGQMYIITDSGIAILEFDHIKCSLFVAGKSDINR